MATILIAEDDLTIRTELKTLLGKYGCSVLLIEDFTVVSDFVLKSTPHLVLLNINFPIYDGYHICSELCLKLGLSLFVQSEVEKGTSVELVFPKSALYFR